MEFRQTEIAGVVEIVPRRFGDDRGWFSEVYRESAFVDAGIDVDWVQDNQSMSVQAGTVRGLHLQVPPLAQAKLVRVLFGAIFDVAVDVRRGAPTYGRWVARVLSADAGHQLLVPTGFAHGFMTLEANTQVHYKVSAPYSKEHERAIRWDDPAIGIDWPDTGRAPTLSGKDNDAPPMADFASPFRYGEARR